MGSTSRSSITIRRAEAFTPRLIWTPRLFWPRTGFRRPKAYYLVGELPKNPTGKIAKGQLRTDIVDGALLARPE